MKSLSWRIVGILVLVAASIFVLMPRDVTQRAYNPATGRMQDTVVPRVPIKLGLDLRGGIHLALEIDQSKQTVDRLCRRDPPSRAGRAHASG